MNTTSTAAMKFSVEVVILPVRDVNRALRFYIDQVGFTCCSSAPSPGAQSKTVRGRPARYDLRECATSDAFLSAPRIVFGCKVRLGSKADISACPHGCPLYPQKWTSLRVISMSALCQKRRWLKHGRGLSVCRTGYRPRPSRQPVVLSANLWVAPRKSFARV